MTAQAAERLLHKGQDMTLCTNPLEPYLKSGANPLRFQAPGTSLWRGYVGTWAIENQGLYLVSLRGYVGTMDEVKEVGLEALFPGYPQGVFAHWFSGELRCPSGALLHYVHGSYASSYERDLFIEVRRGVVGKEHEVVNGQAEPKAPEGYTLAAHTSMGNIKRN